MWVKVHWSILGKKAFVVLVWLVFRVKTVKFYNCRRSEACSGVDDVLWKQPRNAYGLHSVNWILSCDRQLFDTWKPH